jgi:hypothetical protein
MQTAYIILTFLILTVTSFGQLPKKAMKKMGQNPALFIDSVEVEMSRFQSLNPFDISNISIVKPKTAKKTLGVKGTDDAVYVTTVKSTKQAYWTFFSKKSIEYKQLINSPQADTVVQYVLNGQPLSDNTAPGTLFLITDKNFRGLEIIGKKKLLRDNVIPKCYVVAIRAKYPKGLVKASRQK